MVSLIKNANNNSKYLENKDFYNGIDIKFEKIDYSVFEYDVLRLKFGMYIYFNVICVRKCCLILSFFFVRVLTSDIDFICHLN